VHLLVKIVSRGGNFLLNIGPGPIGDWDTAAYNRLKDMGAWMKINSEGIYGSIAIAPYQSGNLFYTKSKTKITFIYSCCRMRIKLNFLQKSVSR